jgi:hypothetical protein
VLQVDFEEVLSSNLFDFEEVLQVHFEYSKLQKVKQEVGALSFLHFPVHVVVKLAVFISIILLIQEAKLYYLE